MHSLRNMTDKFTKGSLRNMTDKFTKSSLRNMIDKFTKGSLRNMTDKLTKGSLRNMRDKLTKGSLFYLFLKLVQINYIFCDNVRILYYIHYFQTPTQNRMIYGHYVITVQHFSLNLTQLKVLT